MTIPSKDEFNFLTDENKKTLMNDFEHDPYDDKELDSLASSLAPRVTELLSENALDVLLGSYTNDVEEVNSSHALTDSDDEEDGMNSEWKRLRAAEESLREELEYSAEYGLSLFYDKFLSDDEVEHEFEPGEEQKRVGTNEDMASNNACQSNQVNDKKSHVNKNDNKQNLVNSKRSINQMKEKSANLSRDFSRPTGSSKNDDIRKIGKYTLFDHAEHLSVQFDPIDLQYPTSPIMTKDEVEGILALPNFHISSPPLVMDHQSNYDENGHMKLFTGEGFDDNSNSSPNSSFLQGNSSTESFPKLTTTNDALSNVTIEEREKIVQDILSCTREYVRPLPLSVLTKIYAGIVGSEKSKRQRKRHGNDNNNDDNDLDENKRKNENLPVRTCIFRIRPDVLCGAVMDAVNTTVETLKGDIIKRQGSHLRAVLPGIATGVTEETKVSYVSSWSPFSSFSNRKNDSKSWLPPFVIDAQIVTRKRSRDAERVLLLRAYAVSQGSIIFSDDGPIDIPRVINDNLENMSKDLETSKSYQDAEERNDLILEAAMLVQRISWEGGNAVFCDEHTNSFLTSPSPRRDIYESNLEIIPSEDGSSTFLGFLPSGGWLSPAKTPKSSLYNSSPSSTSTYVSREDLSREATSKLFNQARPTASINKLNLTTNDAASPGDVGMNGRAIDSDPIPALSNQDWPYVQSSYRFMKECFDELDSRDLAYNTLVSCPFGAFPALPTLDVQYCSQIKTVCKENMVISLLKAASELEQFARESEYSCAVMVKLMKSTFYSYGMDEPDLPLPVPLVAYPLDFQPPETSCPPWGQRVLEALNYVAKSSSYENANATLSATTNGKIVEHKPKDTNESSIHEEIGSPEKVVDKKPDFYRARDAIHLVCAAFQRQFDEEQSARLGRKNMQVMDRLAKMLAHKRKCISVIRDAYGRNEIATQAANDFHNYAENYFSKPGHEMQPYYPASDQVPLLTFRVLVGSSTGFCYITAHQMLLVTQSIPILGGNSYILVPLAEIALEVLPPSTSILNPLPTGLRVRRCYRDKENLFSFIPSIGAKLLKTFIDNLQDVLAESPEALNFSAKGGLLYLYDENQSVAKAALGESHT